MISVIVPALNESERIGSVVELAWSSPGVTEVLVVDDGSIDGTPEAARAAGATVITSTLLGKGASMEDGLCAARNELLVYLDGDLAGLAPDLIERLTRPLHTGAAEFVKARFSRSAGRVTLLTARPLLRTFFPEVSAFAQPLSGIIAARRSLLRRLRFESDYGVDVGLLLDAAAAGAPLAEVDIGTLEHDSHPLEVLGDMANQVVRTILGRAAQHGRLGLQRIREAEEKEWLAQAELSVVLQKIGHVEKLALFDMDGVLVEGRFIEHLAQRLNKWQELVPLLDHPTLPAEVRTQKIAALFVGVSRDHIEQTARTMPLMPGAPETVVALRKAGYRVGIVTDSYRAASEIVRRRVFADFSVAHLLKYQRGQATGQVVLSPAMTHEHGCPLHAHCKLNVLLHLVDKLGLGPERVLAVGDGENDICLLRAAGNSVAFNPKTERVAAAATHVVQGNLLDLCTLEAPCQEPLPRQGIGFRLLEHEVA